LPGPGALTMTYIPVSVRVAIAEEVIQTLHRRGLRFPPKHMILKAAAAVEAADPSLKDNPRAAVVPMVVWLLKRYEEDPW
jgi:hypothetical protein